jgi:hypothetical protein
MKTKKITSERIHILFSLVAILLFSLTSRAQLNVDASNNVGIGTSTLDTKLVIQSDATGYARIGGSTGCGSGYTGISLNGNAFSSCSNYNFVSSPADQTLYINRPTSNQIRFRENNGTDQLTILSGGNIGIGNSAPGYKLDVSGDINVGALSNAFRIAGWPILCQYGQSNNLFAGVSSGANTTASPNNAFGYASLNNNTTGTHNNAFGYWALTGNVSSNYNSAFGDYTLTNNTASSNSAFGYQALKGNTTGSGNTGIGVSAGLTNTTGSNNTYVGYAADANGTGYSNSTGIGYAAPVKTSAAGYVVIGNASVSSIGGYVGWTTYISDARCKKDVQTNVPGLTFIKKLRPVTYHLDMNQIATLNHTPDSLRLPDSETAKGNILYSGFIAQEVEQAAQQLNYNFSGNYIPNNPNDLHGLSYSDFVMPLVKAVQELSGNSDSLETVIHKQDSLITKQDSINKALQDQINQIVNNCCNAGNRNIQNSIGNGDSKNVGSIDVELNNVNAIVLNDAVPNPFAEQTVIGYNIPQNFNNAQILFYDNNGQLIKSVDIKTAGKGQLNVFANDLSNGTYSYTLVVDGKIIATKRMIRQQ